MTQPFVINRSVAIGVGPFLAVVEWDSNDPNPLSWGYDATNGNLAALLMEVLVDSEMLQDDHVDPGHPLASVLPDVMHAEISTRDDFTVNAIITIDGTMHLDFDEDYINMNDTDTGFYANEPEKDGIQQYVKTIAALRLKPEYRMGANDKVSMHFKWVSDAYDLDNYLPSDESVSHHMTINLIHPKAVV